MATAAPMVQRFPLGIGSWRMPWHKHKSKQAVHSKHTQKPSRHDTGHSEDMDRKDSREGSRKSRHSSSSHSSSSSSSKRQSSSRDRHKHLAHTPTLIPPSQLRKSNSTSSLKSSKSDRQSSRSERHSSRSDRGSRSDRQSPGPVHKPSLLQKSNSLSSVTTSDRHARTADRPRSSSSSSKSHKHLSQQPPKLGRSKSAGHLHQKPGRFDALSSSERPVPGSFVGLKNLGNTCYMNSIIQCLLKTPGFVHYFGCDAYKIDSPSRSAVSLAFGDFVHDVMKTEDHGTVIPKGLKRAIGKRCRQFEGSGQQDAQELLRGLLDALHEDVNRVKKKPPPFEIDEDAEDRMQDRVKGPFMFDRYQQRHDSILVDLFCGQLRSAVTCQSCRTVSTCFDVFWDLSVPVPKKRSATLDDCLERYTEIEDLDGDERYLCRECKTRQRSTKQMQLFSLPRILVLHLKRFSSFGTAQHGKITTNVDFPLQDLDMSPYLCTSAVEGDLPPVYDCFAVCSHIGSSLRSGHYVAHCKDSSSSNKWYLFNDSNVSLAKKPPSGSEAFVLFYMLQT